MKKKVYKIQGMDCDACAKLIELDLEDAGIKASCNYATEKLEIEIDNKNQIQKALDVVMAGGYKMESA